MITGGKNYDTNTQTGASPAPDEEGALEKPEWRMGFFLCSLICLWMQRHRSEMAGRKDRLGEEDPGALLPGK